MLDKNFSSHDIEKRHYEAWIQSGQYKVEVNTNKQPYTIMMPPPNVTGSLHIGHALTFTLQDTLIRYHRMKGYSVLWQPGQDHAGIATQMVVERELNKQDIDRRDIGREKFLEHVWKWKEESGGKILHQLERLGALPDWDRNRFTMDEGLSKAVRKVFVEMYNKGLIYKDKRLANWDPKLKTAISDLEVEQKETNGHLWYLRYPLESNPEQFIIVATTRPETMLGDTAVAVHPEDERYKNLIGQNVLLPISNRKIPIIADDYADPEAGSGAVKITPAHDFNDFEVGSRNNLDFINIFDASAHVNENAPQEFVGLDRYEARKKVIEKLEELGLLEKTEDHLHMVPHGDRSGVAVEPWLTDQWFIKAEDIVKPAIDAVKTGKTRIIPQQWEKTYFEWLNNIQPWCISRQLWWGHQIPAWYGPDGKAFVAYSEEEAQQQAKEHYQKEVELNQDPGVLDTWFSSALWPFSTLGWPEENEILDTHYPTSVLVTGFDILFFWVARMMMMGLHFKKEIPFKDVYIHALIRDEKGQKMSKSKGNVIDPLELIDEFSADSVRFTLTALAAPGRDIKLAKSRVEGYRNFTTKIWNSVRFSQMNGCHWDSSFDPTKAQHSLNQWIISEVTSLNKKLDKAFKSYRFDEIAHELYHFVWHTFCDWYLELVKPILFTEESTEKKEVQQTTAWVINNFIHFLHPVMPFVTEELWSQTRPDGKNLLFTSSWPEFKETLIHEKACDEINWLITLITDIRAIRSEMNIPAGKKITLIAREVADKHKEYLSQYSDIIQKLARLDKIENTSTKTASGAIQVVNGTDMYVIPLEGVIDFESEKQRLEKEISKVTTEINKLDSKLLNPGFIQKAPEHVVNDKKDQLVEAKMKHEQLNKALNRLKSA